LHPDDGIIHSFAILEYRNVRRENDTEIQGTVTNGAALRPISLIFKDGNPVEVR
jgi:hypothetical protein